MTIRSTIKADARRNAILGLARMMLGPMYDPEKEDEYVRVLSVRLNFSEKRKKS